MEIVAKLNRFRISPRKARLVADLVRGMEVEQAKTHLGFSSKRASEPILKLLNSAIANAKNNFSKTEEKFYIKKIFVNQGQTYKRFRPRARGMVSPINKKTSHITIVLDERASEQKVGKNKSKSFKTSTTQHATRNTQQ